MRTLNTIEIAQLEQQNCRCCDWKKIKVADSFTPQYLHHVQFSGEVQLGTFEKESLLPTGETLHAGICHSILHHCNVGNNVYIHNCHIANYSIADECYLDDIKEINTTGNATFGNGTEVHVLNEAGGRDVKVYDKLSAQVAYILTFYRHNKTFIQKLNDAIERYVQTQTSTMGEIGTHACIKHCCTIHNVKIGAYAKLDNAAKLTNGTICSDEENETIIENGVVAQNFIIGKGSKVYDYALIENTFIGEACEVGKQYSAVDSLIFCNSQLLHGEACAIFAGPYTTSHHKSTLLIGSMFSFYNAGSGTNQSNHMYKLGPVHQGVLERGVKTGSDSYMMLEARVGAFSLVLGHHEKHFDTSDMPFSYILSEENRTMLLPAFNLQTVGTQRDARKWQSRDKRKGIRHTDFINFDLLNPYTIGKIQNAISILQEMQNKTQAIHNYKNVCIKSIFLNKSINIYKQAILIYFGEKLAKHIDSLDNMVADTQYQKWVDIAGLIVPKFLIDNELKKIETGEIDNIEDVNNLFETLYSKYDEYEWKYVCLAVCNLLKDVTKDNIKQMMTEAIEAKKAFTTSVMSDAMKEFDNTSSVGFGIDDTEMRAADFEAVRGNAKDNSILQQLVSNSEKDVQNMETAIGKL